MCVIYTSANMKKLSFLVLVLSSMVLTGCTVQPQDFPSNERDLPAVTSRPELLDESDQPSKPMDTTERTTNADHSSDQGFKTNDLLMMDNDVVVDDMMGDTLPSDMQNIEDQIKAVFVAKYGWNGDNLSISVNQQQGNFAMGGVKDITSPVGGGAWLAVKKDGQWKLLFDGNGTVMCDQVEGYEVPSSMISECFDQATGQMMKL